MTAVAEYLPTIAPSPAAPDVQVTERWSPLARAAFRFSFLYFGLYVLLTQMFSGMLLVPKLPGFVLGEKRPFKDLVMGVGHNVLHVQPILAPTGSGDTMYDWTLVVTLFLIAATGTLVWTFAGRAATSHPRLFKWFRLFIRFALGTTMLSYGFAKVFPLQMPTIFLSRLLEPYGNFSPMGVIWYSIGAAPGYERFIGFAEVLGGTLLFIPATALVGALVTFGVTTGVFVVNMTYDVPVKQFAFHLVLMSIFLLAPDIRRLLDALVLNRPVSPKLRVAYGSTSRSNRAWAFAQVLFALWALGIHTYQGAQGWRTYGGGAPKSPLYGIWDIDSMSINGELRPPLLTDSARYSHAVFQAPTGVTFQRMDQTFLRYGATIDTVAHTISLKKGSDTTWKPVLGYTRPTPTQLALEGDVDGKRIKMLMTLHDLQKFLLISRGFHWVQEQPVNR